MTMSAEAADLQKALALLPHGAEFRFIDRMLRLDPGKSGSAEYRVRGDESFLRGHFPNEPLFPGVLLIEAAAQLAGVVGQSDPSRPVLPNLRLTAIRAVKIFGTAQPGETILLEAQILARMDHLIQSAVTLKRESTLLLQGELTLSGTP